MRHGASYVQCLWSYAQHVWKRFTIKTWEASGIVSFTICIMASRLTFCFCFVTKAYHPPISASRAIATSRWGSFAGANDPVPRVSKPLAAWEQTASVCYGRWAFRKERGKESLEDEPRCAHKWRAGLRATRCAPVWGEVVGVFTLRTRAFLQVVRHSET